MKLFTANISSFKKVENKLTISLFFLPLSSEFYFGLEEKV